MIGECFFYDTPPNDRHMFVVLAPSLEQRGWFICSNITEKREGCDTTCELLQGEHPNLTLPVSVVNYSLTRELPLPLIERETAKQRLQRMDGELLRRIQVGAIGASSRMKKGDQECIRRLLNP